MNSVVVRSGNRLQKVDVTPEPVRPSEANVQIAGSRSLCLEIMEWKSKSESNRHTFVICHAQMPEQKMLDL